MKEEGEEELLMWDGTNEKRAGGRGEGRGKDKHAISFHRKSIVK